MSKDSSHEPELRLLLEDYRRRETERPEGVGPSAGPALESPEPRLLLEDFGSGAERWLESQGETRLTANRLDDPGIHLLVEDFDPVGRYRERNSGSSRPIRSDPGPEPNFLVDWGDARGDARRRRSRAASGAVHLALILVALAQPYVPRPDDLTEPDRQRDFTQISLLAPTPEQLRELTEQAPPKEGPQTLTEGESPVPVPMAPPPPKPEPEPPAPVPAPATQPVAPEQQAPPQPTQPEPEPTPAPAVEAPAARAPAPGRFQPGRQVARSRPAELPMPRAPRKTVEKPKLELENPRATMPAPEGLIQIGEMKLATRPDQMIQNAVEQMVRQGGGRQAVGDGVGANRAGTYSAPSPGNVGSGLELLSDPKGVDFRPYLLQVLNAVRRNWFAVIPESARLGMEKGRSAIQFSIDRRGDVPKLVIASSSGSPPLDRAAVAGISASQPLPPLPREFTGDEIRIQFVFLYNIKR